MTHTGGCHCGAIRYEVTAPPKDLAICHCTDCRRNAGAPMVAWAGCPEGTLKVTKGAPKTFNSAGVSFRSFCGDCGTGLFYRNADFLPGIVEVQIGTFDDPAALAPTVQIQVAERLPWVKHVHELPEIERFP